MGKRERIGEVEWQQNTLPLVRRSLAMFLEERG